MTDLESAELFTTSGTIDSIVDRLEKGQQVFAILDACDDPRVPIVVSKLGNDKAVSLFSGSAAMEFSSIAPYIAKLDADWIRWIAMEFQGAPWGFLFTANSRLDFELVRRHWKKFLMVQAPDGRKLYFRFYDPRVLETFLGASTSSELDQFFGPIEEIVLLRSNNEVSVYCRTSNSAAGNR
ncbi:MAG: DUF4123 domain-containing protein [Pirellulaceae bacterium]|nr:DUF4123 domain-containing protein [Pirellulaceae bacterium]